MSNVADPDESVVIISGFVKKSLIEKKSPPPPGLAKVPVLMDTFKVVKGAYPSTVTFAASGSEKK